MHELFDRSAPKKATNLSINSSLLAEAKSLKVNLSATLEHALEAELRESKRDAWVKENKAAIANCNKLVNKHGLFADKHRGF
jgi:antitoxin CcdA